MLNQLISGKRSQQAILLSGGGAADCEIKFDEMKRSPWAADDNKRWAIGHCLHDCESVLGDICRMVSNAPERA